MADKKVIEVSIHPDGNVTIEPIEGFKDGSCLKETEALEAALGGDVTKRTKKAEAFVPPAASKSSQKVGK